MDKKKVSVFVAGQRFNILTEQEEKYVRELASRIDTRITSTSLSGNMTRECAAVLTALDLADDGEQLKREIGEIREQVKDYLTRIEALTAENTQMKAELSKAQLTSAALDDARAAVAAGDRECSALKKQITALMEQIALMQSTIDTLSEEAKKQQKPEESAAPAAPEAAPPAVEEQPIAAAPEQTTPAAPEEAPVITAQDDLFFDAPLEEPVRPARKEKKNRHEHKHNNPYKQQFMQQQGEPKGYTQQRQYSLFDLDETD